MTALFNRLGVVGVSLVAGALIFGAITGGIVVHRLERPTFNLAISGHGDQKGSKSSARSQDKQDQQGGEGEQQDSKSNADIHSGSSKDRKDSD